MARQPHIRSLALESLLLCGLWLVLSGVFDVFHVGAGVASVLFVVWFNAAVRSTPLSRDDHREARILVGRFLLYCVWLLWEVVVSSLQVARIVLSPTLPIEPHLYRFRTRLPNLTAKVLLANSITLTPGTVTIEMKGDEYYVHALTRATAESLLGGTMPRNVAAIFGGKESDVLYDLRHIRSEQEL